MLADVAAPMPWPLKLFNAGCKLPLAQWLLKLGTVMWPLCCKLSNTANIRQPSASVLARATEAPLWNWVCLNVEMEGKAALSVS